MRRPWPWASGTSTPGLWSVRHTTQMSRSPPVRACWLGSAGYRTVWDIQAELVEAVRDGRAPDTLLLLEHPHVFTMGKAASADDLLWDEAERTRRTFYAISPTPARDATYH